MVSFFRFCLIPFKTGVLLLCLHSDGNSQLLPHSLENERIYFRDINSSLRSLLVLILVKYEHYLPLPNLIPTPSYTPRLNRVKALGVLSGWNPARVVSKFAMVSVFSHSPGKIRLSHFPWQIIARNNSVSS